MVIYLIENLINGKKYIGMDTKNNPNYLGSGILICKAIKKYGKHNFKKTILQVCSSIEELEVKETLWINHFNALKDDSFYNLEDNRKRGINPFANKTIQEKEVIFNKIKSKERNEKIGKSNSKPKPIGFGDKMKGPNPKKGSNNPKGFKGRVSPNEHACVVYLKNGDYVGEYKSQIECAKQLNLIDTQISRVINGRLKTTGGYIIKKKYETR